MALDHLHKKNIVYRDLKCENVLLGADGYISIADFGVAKKLQQDEVAYSKWGLPEYLAPEMLSGDEGYSFSIDWWALGIITYELIVGFPPFYTG